MLKDRLNISIIVKWLGSANKTTLLPRYLLSRAGMSVIWEKSDNLCTFTIWSIINKKNWSWTYNLNNFQFFLTWTTRWSSRINGTALCLPACLPCDWPSKINDDSNVIEEENKWPYESWLIFRVMWYCTYSQYPVAKYAWYVLTSMQINMLYGTDTKPCNVYN